MELKHCSGAKTEKYLRPLKPCSSVHNVGFPKLLVQTKSISPLHNGIRESILGSREDNV